MVFNEDDHDVDSADPGVASVGWTCPGDGKKNTDSKNGKDMQGSDNVTENRLGANNRKGNRKPTGTGRGRGRQCTMIRGKGMRMGMGKGKVLLSKPEGEKACRAVERLKVARGMGHGGLSTVGICIATRGVNRIK
jgi:hypothetical protein